MKLPHFGQLEQKNISKKNQTKEPCFSTGDKKKTTKEANLEITAEMRLEVGTVPDVLMDDQYGGDKGNCSGKDDSCDSGCEELTVVIDSDSYTNQDNDGKLKILLTQFNCNFLLELSLAIKIWLN